MSCEFFRGRDVSHDWPLSVVRHGFPSCVDPLKEVDSGKDYSGQTDVVIHEGMEKVVLHA